MNTELTFFDEIIVDNFAGGGGASTGMELATGRPVDYAINHDIEAINMHKANHPYTTHFCESVWDIDPKSLCAGRKVALAWFSPDCKHFSKAKGGKPREKKIRGLAWIVLKWAGTVKPRVIILENVEEFKTWGPLKKGKIIKNRKGETFEKWKSQLESLGYKVEHNELKACDYGAPTIRKRFFVIARSDGKDIIFPKATHGNGEGLIPYRTAVDVIDFNIPCKSIFNRSKPLVENTMKRIARGLDKFVLKCGDPFILSLGHTSSIDRTSSIYEPLRTIVSKAEHCVVIPHLIQYHTETSKNKVRGQTANKSLYTLDTNPRYAFKAPYLVEYYKSGRPLSVYKPINTMTTKHRQALIQANIEKLDGCTDFDNWSEIRYMLNTHCDYEIKDNEILILKINGIDYFIADLGLRMLEPRELYNAQGFPEDYKIDFMVDGKSYSKKEQVAKCGNSVPPVFSEALVRANLPEMCGKKYWTMGELDIG